MIFNKPSPLSTFHGYHRVTAVQYQFQQRDRRRRRDLMRVDYRLESWRWFSEWLSFNDSGAARREAERWWRDRSRLPVPRTTREAVELAQRGVLATTVAITIYDLPGHVAPRIVAYELGPIPEPQPEQIPAMSDPRDLDFPDNPTLRQRSFLEELEP